MAAVTCSRRWPDGCWAHSPARIDHECEVNPSLDEVENVCNACTNTLDQPHPKQEPCRDEIWSANAFQPDVDEKNCRLRNLAPICPHCGGLARPNVMMFGDWDWIDRRSSEQWHSTGRVAVVGDATHRHRTGRWNHHSLGTAFQSARDSPVRRATGSDQPQRV